MRTVEFVLAVIVFVIAGVWLFFGARSFKQKGFLLNNAYLWANKEEREAMDKKPYYHQTAVVFCLLSIAFIIVGLSLVLQNYALEWLEIPVFIVLLVYVIVSTARIHKQ